MTPQRSLPAPFFQDEKHQPFAVGAGQGHALLIHGFPGTPAEMRVAGNILAMQGWHARGLLLPGFGPDIASINERSRHDWLAAATDAWREQRQAGKPAGLIGYSMGAAIALHLAAHSPPDFLVLLAPYWQLDTWMRHLLPVARLLLPTIRPFAIADFDDPNVREAILALDSNLDLDDSTIQTFLKEDVTFKTAILSELRQLGRDAYRLANCIDVPTLVIQGHDDVLITPRQTRRLIARLRGPVSYHELPGDHQMPKENRDSMASVLVPFLHKFKQPTPATS